LRISASRWLFIIRIYHDARSSECQTHLVYVTEEASNM